MWLLPVPALWGQGSLKLGVELREAHFPASPRTASSVLPSSLPVLNPGQDPRGRCLWLASLTLGKSLSVPVTQTPW